MAPEQLECRPQREAKLSSSGAVSGLKETQEVYGSKIHLVFKDLLSDSLSQRCGDGLAL